MPSTTGAGSSVASTSTSTSASASASASATPTPAPSTSASGSAGASGSGSRNGRRRRRSGRKSDGSDLIASGAEFYHKLMQEHQQLRQLRSEPISELEYLEKKMNKLMEMIIQVDAEKNRLIEEAKKEKAVLVTLSPEAYFQEN